MWFGYNYDWFKSIKTVLKSVLLSVRESVVVHDWDTTTGLGLRKKNREMPGMDDLVVYMQTVVKYNTFYIHHPRGAKRPRGGVYTNCYIFQQFAYTPPNRPHQPFPFFFLCPNPVVMYIFGVPIGYKSIKTVLKSVSIKTVLKSVLLSVRNEARHCSGELQFFSWPDRKIWIWARNWPSQMLRTQETDRHKFHWPI